MFFTIVVRDVLAFLSDCNKAKSSTIITLLPRLGLENRKKESLIVGEVLNCRLEIMFVHSGLHQVCASMVAFICFIAAKRIIV